MKFNPQVSSYIMVFGHWRETIYYTFRVQQVWNGGVLNLHSREEEVGSPLLDSFVEWMEEHEKLYDSVAEKKIETISNLGRKSL